MASLSDIPSGTKLKAALENKPGEEVVFDMMSTFNKALDDTSFLISIPMRNGAALEANDTQKIILKYEANDQSMILGAYCDDIVQAGIRRYWKMRRVNEQRQFFQRSDERYKIALVSLYRQPTWPVNFEGIIEKDDAMTLDISAGGVALFIPSVMNVGEILQLTLPRVGVDPAGAEIEDLVCVACWHREAPKGSPLKYLCGLQFRFADDIEKQRLRDYIDNLRKVYKM